VPTPPFCPTPQRPRRPRQESFRMFTALVLHFLVSGRQGSYPQTGFGEIAKQEAFADTECQSNTLRRHSLTAAARQFNSTQRSDWRRARSL
jgi:hypothetical protein